MHGGSSRAGGAVVNVARLRVVGLESFRSARSHGPHDVVIVVSVVCLKLFCLAVDSCVIVLFVVNAVVGR